MDLDFDWAECDAKKVDKPAKKVDKPERKRKVTKPEPASSSKCGPPVQKNCLKRPASNRAAEKSPKTAPKSDKKAKKEPSAEAQKTLAWFTYKLLAGVKHVTSSYFHFKGKDNESKL